MTLTMDECSTVKYLREEAETNDGNGWWTVYLDNAKPKDWAPRKWAALLGNLKKKGYYRDIDDPDFKGAFGQIKMTD